MAKKIKIPADKLAISSELIRAIAHPTRLKILSFISKKKVVNVNVIYRELKLEQSITSQHLRILRDNALVNFERDGKKIFYSVEFDRIKLIQETLAEVL